jgi:hypothetical protein
MFRIASHRCARIHQEFFNQLMGPILGTIPSEAYVRSETPRCPGDWMDTAESQALLRYQRRGIAELRADILRNLAVLAPLLRSIRPLMNWFMLRKSPYLEQNRRADQLR